MKIRCHELTKTFPLSSGSIDAVNKVSFEIKEGERVGIIGSNGSGKSTLLSIIAGLQNATSGELEVDGHVDCIMAMGTGIRQDATGRENIYIDGEIRGRTRAETDQIIDQIIEYAELGEYIDRPVSTYSTGMVARLSFSMMIFVRPEILIIDEALSAVDAQFSTKATKTMKEICNRGKILLLVSHSMWTITSMCDRAIWIEKGKLLEDGPAETVSEHYLAFMKEKEEREIAARFQHALINRSYLKGFEVTDCVVKADGGEARRIFELGEAVVVEFELQSRRRLADWQVTASLENSNGLTVWYGSADSEQLGARDFSGRGRFELRLDEMRLGADIYELFLNFEAKTDPSEPFVPAGAASAVFKIEQFSYLYDAIWMEEGHWEVKKV